MSFFSIFTKVLGLVPDVVSAVGAIADAVRPKRDVPKDISTKHAWKLYLSDPPLCAYCGIARTKLNANDICHAFEVKR